MALKKGDFVEVEYEGYILPMKKLFDTTSEELAKKEGIFSKNTKYGPVRLVLGEKQILEGIDDYLLDKDAGKEYEFDIQPEKAFGKRNPKYIQLIPLKQFKDKGVTPVPGFQFALDGALATIRSVTGGRVVVDFNHPLSGRSLHYKIKVLRIVTDLKEKVDSLLDLSGLKNYEISAKEKDFEIKFKKEPKAKDKLKEMLEKKLPGIKVKISVETQKPKKETKENQEKAKE